MLLLARDLDAAALDPYRKIHSEKGKKQGNYLIKNSLTNCANNDYIHYIQVSQVPESSEGVFERSLNLITLDKPANHKRKVSGI